MRRALITSVAVLGLGACATPGIHVGGFEPATWVLVKGDSNSAIYRCRELDTGGAVCWRARWEETPNYAPRQAPSAQAPSIAPSVTAPGPAPSP